jgi:hypothetical protein
LLEFLLSGIDAMGDQIVYTECLIIDMSEQIGVMADRIVETELLAADMADSCCQARPSATALRGTTLVNSSPGRKSKSLTEHSGFSRRRMYDNDICASDPNKRARAAAEKQQAAVSALRALLVNIKANKLLTHIHGVLAMLGIDSSSPFPTATFSRRALASKTPKRDLKRSNDLGLSDGPLPCETWWDPFCCAAEVCADMMVDMLELMSAAGDTVIDMCESCVVEVGLCAATRLMAGYARLLMFDMMYLFGVDCGVV